MRGNLLSRLGLAALLGLLTPAPAELPWPVIAHWSCDAVVDGRLPDGGPHHLDAVLRGEPVPQPTAGQRDGALTFAADSRAGFHVARHPALDLRPLFTVAVWLKPQRVGDRAMEVVCRQDDVEPTGYRLRWGWGQVNFRGAAGAERFSLATGLRTVPDGFWVHAAATHDGQTVRLFINAEEVAAVAAPAGVAPTSRPLVLGNYVGRADAYPFVGSLDDVWVLGAALTADELCRLAAGALP